jgi:hypothetical protein
MGAAFRQFYNGMDRREQPAPEEPDGEMADNE